MTDGSLKGKVALVTGASKGIGRAVSLALAERGATLLLVARSKEALDTVAAACQDAGSPRAVPIVADLATYEGLDTLIMSAVRESDGFDILVNNAGIGDVKPLVDVSDEEFDHTVAVNLRAPFLLTQSAIKMMRRRGGGQIVQIGSGLSYFGRADWSLYAATKFALRGFTESVRFEVAKEGIKVGLVAPGFTDTHFFDDLDVGWDTADAMRPEDVAHAVMAMVEQGPASDIKEIQVRTPKSP